MHTYESMKYTISLYDWTTTTTTKCFFYLYLFFVECCGMLRKFATQIHKARAYRKGGPDAKEKWWGPAAVNNA